MRRFFRAGTQRQVVAQLARDQREPKGSGRAGLFRSVAAVLKPS